MTGASLTERVGAVALMAAMAAVFFNLLAAQVLFGVAAIAWLSIIVRDRTWVWLPAFAWPLGIYAVLTMVSALVSSDPRVSVVDLKQLVLFLMVPIVWRRGPWRCAR
jgi:hypothetical protein